MNSEYLDEEAAKRLIAAVLIRAISDWKMLNYGEYKEVGIPGGTVDRDELIGFIRRGDFEAMLNYVTPVSAKDVYEALRLDKVKEISHPLNGAEIDTLRAMAANSMNICQTAVALRISRNSLYKRLRGIESKTGVDPRNFAGLRQLLIENMEEPREWESLSV